MKKICIVVLVFTLLMMFASLTPALAKNLNYPDDVEKINYINAGGSADIPLITPLPANYPLSAKSIRFSFAHVEIPNADVNFESLLVSYYIIVAGSTTHSWQPFLYLTTNVEQATLVGTVFTGTLLNVNATTIGLPASFSTYNIHVVSEDVLTIERHGNSVSVTLSEPQQIKRPAGPSVYMTFPAFTLELTKMDDVGSIHVSTTIPFTGFTGASGYTQVNVVHGFPAIGSFSSSNPNLNTGPVANATMYMQGTHTYYSP